MKTHTAIKLMTKSDFFWYSVVFISILSFLITFLIIEKNIDDVRILELEQSPSVILKDVSYVLRNHSRVFYLPIISSLVFIVLIVLLNVKRLYQFKNRA